MSSNSNQNKNDKKKIEEKTTKLLRELASLPFNKQCSDCNQKGPTYVNITIGTFVCTACSGILRGLNPPHRVKSINMATFTSDEVDFLKTRGNHYCQLVYMNLFDSTTGTQPDSRDSEKLRDFLTQKYERKRWYTAPTESIINQIKNENENINNINNGNNLTNNMNKLKLGSNNSINSNGSGNSSNQNNNNHHQGTYKQAQHQTVHINNNNYNTNTTAKQASPSSNSNHSSNDIFSTFDAFTSAPVSTTTNTNTTSNSNNFANFANFDLLSQNNKTSSNMNPVVTSQQQQQQATNLFSNQSTITPIQPQKPATQQQQQTNLFSSHNNNIDKYSALAELDSIFQPSSTTTSTQINNHFNSVNGQHQPIQQITPTVASPVANVIQQTNPFASLQPTNTASAYISAHQHHQQQSNPFFNGLHQSTGVPQAPFNYLQPSNPTQQNLFTQPQYINNNMYQQMSTQPVNPFISIAKQQSQLQRPKANSTNPFL